MSLPARRELLASTAPRYAKANKKLKQTILDEFTASTGYHRKYAIDLLKHYNPKTAKSTASLSLKSKAMHSVHPVATSVMVKVLRKLPPV